MGKFSILNRECVGRIYLREVTNDQIQSIFLHVGSLRSIRSFQDIKDIVHGDIALEIGLAEHLQPVVGEDVEVRCRKEIK